MGIFIDQSQDITIRNLTVAESGGDGICESVLCLRARSPVPATETH